MASSRKRKPRPPVIPLWLCVCGEIVPRADVTGHVLDDGDHACVPILEIAVSPPSARMRS